jgi:diacylglycerol O-acyltransferase / wax synthase
MVETDTPAANPGRAAPARPVPAKRRPVVDRLTGEDLSMLWPDRLGWPQDIGMIAVLDAAPIVDSAGRLRIGQVREAIDGRLHLVPRLRQILYDPPLGAGRPLWVDAPGFDIADHVHVLTLPEPADEQQLLHVCEDLHRRQLDRSRPLWQLWLLPGLPDRVGMFMKLHHVVADGMAGMALLGALLDSTPTKTPTPIPATPTARPWTPRPAPPLARLVADNVRRRVTGVAARAARLARPARTVQRMRAGARALAELARQERAPECGLNRPIGADRVIGLARGDLAVAKHLAHSAGATVNDVVLATIASALRCLLESRGNTVDGLVLRAAVPISLHRAAAGPAQGNMDGGMMVALPIGEPDTLARLTVIAADSRRRKAGALRLAGSGISASVTARRLMLRMMAHQHMANVYLANVPGPPAPLYLAGARIREMFPVVPLTGNVTLGVGVLSYVGRLNATVVADPDAVPDLPVFLTGLQRALTGRDS